MTSLPLKSVAVISAFGALASIGFFALSALAAVSFLKERRKQQHSDNKETDAAPGVSILKPLKGLDPDMWQSFCSHCEQDYPEYQLVFGVSDAGDPAVEVIRRLQQEYRNRDIEFVVCEKTLGTNTKVSNLAQMLAAARYPILLVNDSDIRVPSDYLRRIASKFTDDQIGLVTCLYRGVAEKTLGSRLEGLGISTDFIPGVLSARFLENGLRFGLGSTLAFRRSDLEAIGGFESLVDYLADDYELGRRIAVLGKRVELSDAVVTTFLPAYTLSGFFEHQIRWARTIRDARRWGYAGVALTFGLPWSLLSLVLTGGAAWAWMIFGVTGIFRLLMAILYAKTVLNDRKSLRDLYLLPLRDVIAPIVWALSFAGNQIRWRGDLFYLKQGRLARVTREAGT